MQCSSWVLGWSQQSASHLHSLILSRVSHCQSYSPGMLSLWRNDKRNTTYTFKAINTHDKVVHLMWLARTLVFFQEKKKHVWGNRSNKRPITHTTVIFRQNYGSAWCIINPYKSTIRTIPLQMDEMYREYNISYEAFHLLFNNVPINHQSGRFAWILPTIFLEEIVNKQIGTVINS